MPEMTPITEDQVRGLWKLYDVFLLYLLKVLQSDKPPSAFVLSTIRHFLRDNGINAASRAEMQRGLSALASGSDLPFKVD